MANTFPCKVVIAFTLNLLLKKILINHWNAKKTSRTKRQHHKDKIKNKTTGREETEQEEEEEEEQQQQQQQQDEVDSLVNC